MKRDLVCLQIGTAANHVGAHIWNLQDEYLAIPPDERELSPSTFFRTVSPESIAGRRGLLYAPRVQIIDATGAFGALSTTEGAVLSDPDAAAARNAPLPGPQARRYVRAPVRKSPYVRGLLSAEDGAGQAQPPGFGQEDDVQYWSDYLKTRLHPRTCAPLRGVHYDVEKLDLFEKGREMARPDVMEELYDDLRFFIEDCDAFGGVCINTGADDAWAGFASNYMEHLYEELGSSCPVLMFGVHDMRRAYTKQIARLAGREFDPKREATFARNEARLVAKCLDYSTEYVPLSTLATSQIPLVFAKPQSLFHASAVLGLTVNVALTPLQKDLSLAGLISALRPAPFASFGSLVCNFPPVSNNWILESEVSKAVRTIHLSGIRSVGQGNSKTNTLPSWSTVTEIASAQGLPQNQPVLSNVTCPITVPIPFPPIFDASLERNKFAAIERARAGVIGNTAVEQIAVVSALATVGSDGQSSMSALGNVTKRVMNPSEARASGEEEEELREVSETLISRAADYTSL